MRSCEQHGWRGVLRLKVAMGTQEKSMHLILHGPDLTSPVTFTSVGIAHGVMHSAPYAALSALISMGGCSTPGVYVLCSDDSVCVGMSQDLTTRRLMQTDAQGAYRHIAVLTSDDAGLDSTDLAWMASALVERAYAVGRSEVTGPATPDLPYISPTRAHELSRFLAEALFILELRGIETFTDRSGENASPDQERRRTATTDVHNLLAFGKRVKRVAVDYVSAHGIPLTRSLNYAVLKEDGTGWWLNPRTSMLDVDWSIILNDTSHFELIVLIVPAKSLRMAQGTKGGLQPRKDKPIYIDLNIATRTYQDMHSGISFSRYIVRHVAY